MKGRKEGSPGERERWRERENTRERGETQKRNDREKFTEIQKKRKGTKEAGAEIEEKTKMCTAGRKSDQETRGKEFRTETDVRERDTDTVSHSLIFSLILAKSVWQRQTRPVPTRSCRREIGHNRKIGGKPKNGNSVFSIENNNILTSFSKKFVTL